MKGVCNCIRASSPVAVKKSGHKKYENGTELQIRAVTHNLKTLPCHPDIQTQLSAKGVLRPLLDRGRVHGAPQEGPT